ncbi:MAG: hypothetical protein QXD62_03220, partial [Candidatus Woesearchaeota archaeon]
QIPPEQPQTPPQPQWDPDKQWKFDIVLSGSDDLFSISNPLNVNYEVFIRTREVHYSGESCNDQKTKEKIQKQCREENEWRKSDEIIKKNCDHLIANETAYNDCVNRVNQNYENFYQHCVELACENLKPRNIEVTTSVGVKGSANLERKKGVQQPIIVNKPSDNRSDETEYVVRFVINDQNVTGSKEVSVRKSEKNSKQVTIELKKKITLGGLFGWLAKCFGCE